MNQKLVALFVPAILLLSACSNQVVKTAEMKKPNRFAIVTVIGSTQGLGMSETEEVALLTKLDDIVSKELNQSKNFKLASSSLVKQSRSYGAIKAESTEGLFAPKAAQGYKKFDITSESEAPNLKKLMNELKLTGVIQVTTHYSVKSGGLTLSGIAPIPIPLSAGTASGHIVFSIAVVNSANEIIWRDMVEVTSKDSVGKIMGIGNTAALQPKLIDISQEAVRTALANLDEKLK